MNLLSGLNTPQSEAVTHERGPLLIFAGAGSGKTRTLTHRIAYLVQERDISPSCILAVTFTNKASREMQSRLDSLIGPASRRLWLGTFHAMCARMLRMHGEQIGLDPRFVIYDSDDATRLAKEVLRELDIDSERYPAPRLLGRIADAKNNMRGPQQMADLAASPADRIYARLYAAYQKRLNDSRALDFDDLLLYGVKLVQESPAGQMFAERFQHVLIDEFQDANLAQFTWARELARVHQNIAVVGDDDQCLPPGALVATPQGVKSIEKVRAGELVISGAGRASTAHGKVEKVLKKSYSGPVVHIETKGGRTLRLTPNHICFARENNSSERESIATKLIEQDVHLVMFGGIQSSKSSYFGHRVWCDLEDDLMTHRTTEVRSSVDLAEMLAQKHNCKVRNWAALSHGDKFAFQPAMNLRPTMLVPVLENEQILEDEITSIETTYYNGPVYDLNIEHLHNFVADGIVVHNSIYAWRGADVKLILDFEKHYPDAQVIRLEQNYRSTQKILDAAHGVISQNMGRAPKRLWTDENGGAQLTLHGLANAQEEAFWVARKIQDLQREYNAKLSDFAILCRVNAQSRPFEEAFLRLRIPLKLVGTQRFYDRREIKDLLAYLRVLFNPNDGFALLRIINTPPRGIGATTIQKMQNLASEQGKTLHEIINDEDALKTIGRAPALKISAFAALLRQLETEAQSAASMADLISDILMRTGFENYLRQEKVRDSVDRVANMEEFLSAAVAFDDRMKTGEGPDEEFVHEAAPYLGLFLETTALDSTANAEQSEGEAVTFMTLHSAKGLEFPAVFLVGLEQGLLPHSRALWGASTEDLEEERRLCYVGLTRAEKRVFLTYAAQRTLHGKTEITQPSQFLEEIPAHLLERGGFASARSFTPARAAANAATTWTPPPSRSALVPSSLPKEELAPAKFSIGDKVKHPTFGEGIVLQVTSPGEKNECVHVAFLKSDIGKKILSVAYAPLEKVA